MGEVYKARDTRLDRVVAVKVLPGALAAAPQFRERFDREARAISQLTHPHICTLHDIGEDHGTAFLVMEYLNGETLADRLQKGALPFDQAIKIAIETADALDTAHRAGITHRDHQPATIMLTGAGAKLLDYRLAKPSGQTLAGAGHSTLTTSPAHLTAQGTIVGTLQYMAPEQLEGQEADPRTDIYAFGAVAYEMLTGRKAFEGKSQASLIAAIMHADPPPIAAAQPLASAALDRVVKKCLAKDRDDRWQTARDLLDEVQWIAHSQSHAGDPASAASRLSGAWNSARLAWSIAAICLIATASALSWVRLRPESAALPQLRLDLVTPQTTDPTSFALSPDGRQLVFAGAAASGRKLWLRSLEQSTPRPLEGTDGATYPFWAPDSRSIGFFADNKMFRLDVAGGSPEVLANVSAARGGAWSRNGVILFSPGSPAKGLMRVAATGGPTSPATHHSADEGSHRWPSFLPDGRHFLFFVSFARPEVQGVYLGSLDAPETRRLLAADTAAAYAAPGYLLLMRQGTLMAAPFEAGRGALTGEPFPVAPGVAWDANLFRGALSVSGTGLLAYRAGGTARRQLTWFDRAGTVLGTLGSADDQNLIFVELAHDGQRVAVTRTVQGNSDVWLIDAARGAPTRLTSDASLEDFPVWAPDDRRLAFRSNRHGISEVFEIAPGGNASDEHTFATSQNLTPVDWSPDGKVLLCVRSDPKTQSGDDLFALATNAAEPPFAVLQTPFDENEGQFSPDGRWIAYRSNESGRAEVYVQPFPGPGRKLRVSTTGGQQPRWRRNGKRTLLYRER